MIDNAFDIVLTLQFGRDITIAKIANFDKVNHIEIEPALATGNRPG